MTCLPNFLFTFLNGTQLTNSELYQILRLRSEIFIVEQNCVYQDIDDKDLCALHVQAFHNGRLVAYCRLFKPNDYFEENCVGRVIVAADYRKNGIGHLLMKKAIETLELRWQETAVTISAQLYLTQYL